MARPEHDILITEGHATAKVEPKSAAGMVWLQIFYPQEFHGFIASGLMILLKDDDWHELLAKLEMSKLNVKKVISKSKS